MLGRQSSPGPCSQLTIPDGYHFLNASGLVEPTRYMRRKGELRLVRTAPEKLVLGMLSLFRYPSSKRKSMSRRYTTPSCQIDEYREHITPYGHSYEQWFGGRPTGLEAATTLGGRAKGDIGPSLPKPHCPFSLLKDKASANWLCVNPMSLAHWRC